MTLRTPLGKPTSTASLASIMAAVGSRSDGLRTIVLPAAVASGNIYDRCINKINK